jgi:hypothetical protein
MRGAEHQHFGFRFAHGCIRDLDRLRCRGGLARCGGDGSPCGGQASGGDQTGRHDELLGAAVY